MSLMCFFPYPTKVTMVMSSPTHCEELVNYTNILPSTNHPGRLSDNHRVVCIHWGTQHSIQTFDQSPGNKCFNCKHLTHAWCILKPELISIRNLVLIIMSSLRIKSNYNLKNQKQQLHTGDHTQPLVSQDMMSQHSN